MRYYIWRGRTQTYVEAAWQTQHGDHSRDVWGEMPEDVKAHLSAFLDWGDEHEPKLEAEIIGYERGREIDRQIAALKNAKAGLRQ